MNDLRFSAEDLREASIVQGALVNHLVAIGAPRWRIQVELAAWAQLIDEQEQAQLREEYVASVNA